MRDIVARLRDPPLAERNEGIKLEAADEIEKLRDQISELVLTLRDLEERIGKDEP